MVIVGISCHYHDAAACVIRDGQLVAAAEEERFTRQKHSAAFPKEALNFCIQQAGLTFSQVDHVAFYEKPFLKFARTLYDHLEEFPFSLKHFLNSMPHWLGERLVLPEYLSDEISLDAPLSFVPHHFSHAAFAYYLSGFSEASLLTLDGVGEWSTATRGYAKGGKLTLEEEVRYPDSLGLFYGAVAEHLGFGAVGGEGKLMGLAAYGQPSKLREMEALVAIDASGGFHLDRNYFSFRRGLRMGSARLEKLLGPARGPEEEITDAHRDIAASAQAWLERAILTNAAALRARHGLDNLCIGGGVGLNCLANAKVLEQSGFKRVFVPPGCGDSGGAIGAALFVARELGERPLQTPLFHSYWGPAFADREILRELRASGLAWRAFGSEEELLRETGERIAKDRVVGWFQGAMEFGPRSLGARSILANPQKAAMRDRVNGIKRREKFRPFAPMVPQERVGEFFEATGDSPFMLFAFKTRKGLEEKLSAVTHVDGTARVQTVRTESNSLLHRLLISMEARIGVPVLLNTSFNLDSEPVVCSPSDAVSCFSRSGLDDLIIGNYLVTKA